MEKLMDTFEELLKRQKDNSSGIIAPEEVSIKDNLIMPKEKLQANKSADIDGFIEMVSMLVTKSMRKDNVVFEPDEGARPMNDASEKIESPHIYYQVISSQPKKELKPRDREQVVEFVSPENKNLSRQGIVHGQKFDCIIQFDILASGYKEANKVMKSLEDLIFRYTGFFKKNGVSELLYHCHYTDRTLDPYRQKLSVRSIQYWVELEKLFTVYTTEFRDISVNR